jgi:excisionase family DNA binding protein
MSLTQQAPEANHLPGQPWTVKEVANYLKISQSTVFSMLNDGRIRSITISRRRFIPDSEVKRLAEEGC